MLLVQHVDNHIKESEIVQEILAVVLGCTLWVMTS